MEFGVVGLAAWAYWFYVSVRRAGVWIVAVLTTLLVGAAFIDLLFALRPMVLLLFLVAVAWMERPTSRRPDIEGPNACIQVMSSCVGCAREVRWRRRAGASVRSASRRTCRLPSHSVFTVDGFAPRRRHSLRQAWIALRLLRTMQAAGRRRTIVTPIHHSLARSIDAPRQARARHFDLCRPRDAGSAVNGFLGSAPRGVGRQRGRGGCRRGVL